MFEIILAAGVVMIVSLVGVIFTARFAREFLERRLSTLVSFSAGVFLVTAGALALEVFHVIDEWWIGIGLILLGYIAAWALHAILPETHHHHDPTCHRSHGRARKLVIGDAIHNVADGIILVPAFLASPALGMAVTVSIVIHEVLQEISEFFVLRQAGYSTRQALTINFLVSSTIFVGVGLSYVALVTANLEGLLLAVSAGFFLHVVAHDLLPKRSQHPTARALALQLGVVALGALVMGGISTWFGEAHVHGETAYEHDHEAHGHEEHEYDHEYDHDKHEHEADAHHEDSHDHIESVRAPEPNLN